MKIKIWGCRGSIPVPLNNKQYKTKMNSILQRVKPEYLESEQSRQKYINSLPFYLKKIIGGNTTCIEIRDEENNVVIIDTGSGARELGNSLLQEFHPGTQAEFNILYTHTHWDHICGLMFFAPMYIPSFHFTFWSMFDDLKKRLVSQQNAKFFPIDFEYMASKKEIRQFPIGKTISINNLKITSMEMNHPGGCLGYRIEEKGSVFTFCTDTEFNFDNKDESKKY
nr:MBL fold metallo-hydrolase [Spirochaetaceae bacterium]